MLPLHFTAERSSDGVTERDFTLGEVTGVLWSPESGSPHAPLVLMGHGGGLHKKTPPLVARAHHRVTAHGFTVVAIDAPGHGDRPLTAEVEQARTEIIQAAKARDTERVRSVIARLGAELARDAVPEWQAPLDALQRLPEIGAEAPVGYGGGLTTGTSIGIPLTAVEPRITAAIFGGGVGVADEALHGAAARITVPVQFLLPWDDERVDRPSALALFDAFASEEKALHANSGDHRTVSWFGLDDAFLVRHLRGTAASAA